MSDGETCGCGAPWSMLPPEHDAPADQGSIAVANTDRHLWPQVSEDTDAPTMHVTAAGGIGINVGGHVIVKSLADWHALAKARTPAPEPLAEIERLGG